MRKLPELYNQEILHFTIDCHRYKKTDELPEDINEFSLKEQQKEVISPEELRNYSRILREEIGKEEKIPAELKGVAFGGDGLVIPVYYEFQRLNDFAEKIGKRVNEEVPSMDFQWGMVKNKIPLRVVNLTRFTGEENRENVIDYVNKNNSKKIGYFNIDRINLVLSDHYIQKGNTRNLGTFNFKR